MDAKVEVTRKTVLFHEIRLKYPSLLANVKATVLERGGKCTYPRRCRVKDGGVLVKMEEKP